MDEGRSGLPIGFIKKKRNKTRRDKRESGWNVVVQKSILKLERVVFIYFYIYIYIYLSVYLHVYTQTNKQILCMLLHGAYACGFEWKESLGCCFFVNEWMNGMKEWMKLKKKKFLGFWQSRNFTQIL